MKELADILARQAAGDGNLARRILDPLSGHDAVLRHLAEIDFSRVRHLQPLAADWRSDALPRASRRVAELPTAGELDGWYHALKAALDALPNEDAGRVLVALLLDTLRGRLDNPRIAVDAFTLALADARVPPPIVAGAVKLAWRRCRTKPSIAAFLKLCGEHRGETQAALDLVCRCIGLRRDAEKVVARPGQAVGHQARMTLPFDASDRRAAS